MAVAEQLQVAHWPVAQLRPNPLNPRSEMSDEGIAELAASIQAQGILQPLLVTPDGLVVAGHRRLAAAQRAGLLQLPVLVRDLSSAEQLEIMLVENIQREDLTPLEEARAYQRLLDSGRSKKDLARAVGVSVNHVAARLTLLKLDAAVQQMVEQGELPISNAVVLERVHDRTQQRRLATIAVRRRMTADQLKHLVARGTGVFREPKPPRPPAPAPLLGNGHIATEIDDEDDRPAKSVSSTRLEALSLLRKGASRVVTLADLAQHMEETCCACGMVGAEGVCVECPLPELLVRVGKAAAHA